MENNQNINFKLKGIEILHVNVNPLENPLTTETVFNFNINVEHIVNINDNIIIVRPNIQINTENNEKFLGSFSAGLIYEFENLSIFNKENELKLPIDIIYTINSISISTMRGIMFSTFKGTHLHNAILPIIDPKSFNQSV